MNEYYDLLSRGGISLDRLVSLCRVVDAGGLSRAAGGEASRLSLYSRQLKDLETFLGVALTRKVGRTVTLTDTAKALAATTRAHLKALQAFVGRDNPAIPFAIGASHSLLEWYVLPRLPDLRKALGAGRPIRLLALRSVQVGEMLEDHRLEMGLVRSDAVPRGLAARPLFRMGYALYARRSHVQHRRPRDVLMSAPLAMALDGQARTELEAAARKARIALRIALECTSFSLAAAAVRAGSHAAILPDIVPATAVGEDVVRQNLPVTFGYSRQISACWHRAQDGRPLAIAKILAS